MKSRKKTSDLKRDYTELKADQERLKLFWKHGLDAKTFPKLKSAIFELGGLNPLLLSFSGASITEPRDGASVYNREWNPFAQRISMGHWPTDLPPLSRAYGDVQVCFSHAVLLLHDALHIAYWEPFFSGQLKIRDLNEVSFRSFLSEGFNFFHTDIYMSSRIRRRYKMVEPIYSRTTAAQQNFHPSLAFREQGIKSESKILEIYLKSFAGFDNGLHRRGFFSKGYFGDVRGLYRLNLDLLDDFTKKLGDQGVFDEFQTRFCFAGLPSLFKLNATDPYGYTLAFARKHRSLLAKLSRAQVSAVRERRAIQTRAYFALQLKQVLETKNHCGQFSTRSEVTALKRYLDELEILIHRLGDCDVASALSKIDRRYESDIRRPLAEKHAQLARREFVFPKQPVAFVSVDANDLKNLEREKLYLFLTSVAQKRAQTAGPQDIQLLPQRIEACGQILKANPRKAARLLQSPSLLPLWSRELAANSPLENSFRELTFVYE